MESVRLVIPGAFGYRMTDLDGKMTESSYWGGVGRGPRWRPGFGATGLMRHSGSGLPGLLVVLIGLWAFYQTFRHAGSEERHRVTSSFVFGRVWWWYQWFWPLAATLHLPMDLFLFPYHAQSDQVHAPGPFGLDPPFRIRFASYLVTRTRTSTVRRGHTPKST